jgi:hypothetical protein
MTDQQYVPKAGDRVRITWIEETTRNSGAGHTHQVGDVGVCCRDSVADPDRIAIYIDGDERDSQGLSKHVWCRCEPADSKSAPVDETRAPSPLPEVLPAGTEFEIDGNRFVLVDAAVLSGELYMSPNFTRIAPDYRAGLAHSLGVSAKRINWPSYYAALRPVKDAPARDGSDASPFAENCAECGKPITDPFTACKRTRVLASGRKEYVPGSFHSNCGTEVKPTAPGRTDPYLEHQCELSTRVGLRTDAEVAMMTALDPANKRIRKHEQAKAQLERKVAPKYPHWQEAWSTAGYDSDH